MTQVGTYEAKTHLPALLKRVEAGETITITNHGRPVARLVPAQSELRPIGEVLAEMRAFSVARQPDDDVKSWIDSGRE